MNKKFYSPLILIASGAACVNTSSYAALKNNAILNFNTGVTTCTYHGNCVVKSGSYFGMDTGEKSRLGYDSNSYNDGFIIPFERTPLEMNEGLILGTTQTASGSHQGMPGCESGTTDSFGTLCTDTNPSSENPGIDLAWGDYAPDNYTYFSPLDGNTGMHSTINASHVLSASGNSATVDFSGWSMIWSGYQIDLSTGAWAGNADGVATIVCGIDCSDGDTFTLAYSATFPIDVPAFPEGVPSLSGVLYELHLEGTISAVPLPAAAWLFGSGLIGLVGFARCKKHKTNQS